MRSIPLVFPALVALLASVSAHVGKPVERPVIQLSGANFRPLPMAVAPLILSGTNTNRQAATAIDEALNQDLTVSGLFDLLDRKGFLANANEGVLVTEIRFQRWQDIGAEALVKITVSGIDPVAAELHLYSTVTGKEEQKKRYSEPAAQARRIAHRFADDIFTFYTREPGAFQTRMAFVRMRKGVKQIFVSDWDGRNARPVTSASMNLLPAWASDGQHLAYTGYKSGTPELYLIDVQTLKSESLFKRYSTLITGACFSADGKKVAFAMSEEDGNSHIWIADANGENAKRLTEGFGINSSPSFSPDGKRIAFVSNRGGTPQIYLIASDGGGLKRLTFQGNYNQTPDWSPRGDLIAFTARDERNVFDIFTVDPDTGKINRLTQDQGNNEEPTFSPNGRLVAFTSTRAGKSQLFVMSADGNAQRQMTSGDEDAFTPAWGPFVRAVSGNSWRR